jgi:hypothetical protein
MPAEHLESLSANRGMGRRSSGSKSEDLPFQTNMIIHGFREKKREVD